MNDQPIDAGLAEEGRRTPVYRRVDVAVVGGGPSGVAAAIAAARNGAEVLLIERNAMPGGTGPMAFVNEFHSTENMSGIGTEILRRLGELDGAAKDAETEYSQISFDPETFRFVILDMLAECGVQLLFYTWAVEAVMDGDTVRGVIIENKSGRQAVLAKVIIDASGDADIAARIGAEMQPHAEPQPMSMLFRMGGIDFKRLQDYAHDNPGDFIKSGGIPPNRLDGVRYIHVSGWKSLIAQAKADGRLSKTFGQYFTVFGITPQYLARGMAVVYGCHVLNRDPFDADDLTAAEIEGRKKVRGYLDFVHVVPGMEKAFLIDLAPNIGVRDSRRIVGDYTLSRDDLFANRGFDDQVSVCTHRGPNIVGWKMHPSDGSEGGQEHLKTVQGTMVFVVFGIPYRCFLPKGIEGLLVVGKTISMDYEAHARCRNQGHCMAFGQAAGVAAAVAAAAGLSPRQVDVQDVRARLKAQGLNIEQDKVNVAKIIDILRQNGREVDLETSYRAIGA